MLPDALFPIASNAPNERSRPLPLHVKHSSATVACTVAPVAVLVIFSVREHCDWEKSEGALRCRTAGVRYDLFAWGEAEDARSAAILSESEWTNPHTPDRPCCAKKVALDRRREQGLGNVGAEVRTFP
jgi:hypothetical protein